VGDLKRFLAPAGVLLGSGVTIVTLVLDAASVAEWGLPFTAYAAGGFLIAITSVLAIIYAHQREHEKGGYLRRGDTVTVEAVQEAKPAINAAVKQTVQRRMLADLLAVTQQERTIPKAGSTSEITGRYLGIRCENRGNQDILNCRIRLEDLKEWLPSFRWWQPTNQSPVLLAWSLHDGGGSTQTIGPGANRTCDFICYETDDAERALLVTADASLRASSGVGFGRWRAICTVEADGGYHPIKFTATFIWEVRELRGPVKAERNLEFLTFDVSTS